MSKGMVNLYMPIDINSLKRLTYMRAWKIS